MLCVMCEVRMGSLHSRSSFNMAIRKAPLYTYRSTWPYERWSRSQGFLNFIVKEFRAVTLCILWSGTLAHLFAPAETLILPHPHGPSQDLWCWGKGLVPSSRELIMFFSLSPQYFNTFLDCCHVWPVNFGGLDIRMLSILLEICW